MDRLRAAEAAAETCGAGGGGTRAARPLAGGHHEVPGECGLGTGRVGRRTFPAGPVSPSARGYRSARRVSESLLPRQPFDPLQPTELSCRTRPSQYARLPEAEFKAVY